MQVVRSALLVGLDVQPVNIEVFIGRGFSGLMLLGVPSEVARDMRERLRAVLEPLGVKLFSHRVVVSCTPAAALRSARTPLEQLDFAVAAAIVRAFDDRASKVVRPRADEFFAGHLALNGGLSLCGTALLFEALSITSDLRFRSPIIHLPSRGTEHLTECHHFSLHPHFTDWYARRDVKKIPATAKTVACSRRSVIAPRTREWERLAEQTLAHFRHDASLLAALMAAAAGRHNILVGGEPGVGKTFAMRQLVNLLPPLGTDAQLIQRLLHEDAAGCPELRNSRGRPSLRMPHHTSTASALVGGSRLSPGEASLAHGGVLLLDEVAEFSRSALESLREPLDSGTIQLSRAGGSVTLPANFLLAATLNPCPCGFLLSRHRPCLCSRTQVARYQQRLSGPLWDRFAILLWLGGPRSDSPYVEAVRRILQQRGGIRELVQRLVGVAHISPKEPAPAGDLQESLAPLRRSIVMQQLHATLRSLFPEVIIGKVEDDLRDFLSFQTVVRGATTGVGDF